ncbi:hypothetical protein QBC36DRAFT_340586 [Triangularia setosa]|uniref:Uncharacterized protein n=1 Tax=Triangularia setosa TaxID=2587417 RepID=A0AAN7A0U1_9PEZI|nr:hypothetical protein QBC36DRAFT_340586 [Podospora setosa]
MDTAAIITLIGVVISVLPPILAIWRCYCRRKCTKCLVDLEARQRPTLPSANSPPTQTPAHTTEQPTTIFDREGPDFIPTGPYKADGVTRVLSSRVNSTGTLRSSAPHSSLPVGVSRVKGCCQTERGAGQPS